MSSSSAKAKGLLLVTVTRLAVAAAATAVASPISAETLSQALTNAYRWNPELEAQRARLRATDEDVARAMSGYRPVITGVADAGHQNLERSGFSQSSNPRGYRIDLVQPIFDGFQTRSAVGAAEANVRAGRAELSEVENRVLLEAVTAYMAVLRDGGIVAARVRSANVIARELGATKQRLLVGEATTTDVAQAEARLAGARSSLNVARANLTTSEAKYNKVIGHVPVDLVEPVGYQKLLPPRLEDALQAAEAGSPAILRAVHRAEAARLAIDQLYGSRLPQARIEASYSERFEDDPSTPFGQTGLESRVSAVSARLTIPIYQGGETDAAVRQAKQEHLSRLSEVETARTQTRSTILSAWARLVANRTEVDSSKTIVSANEAALSGVRLEQIAGQRTLLDVLNAELDYVNAQVNAASARSDLVVASFAVLAAVGRLEAKTIFDGIATYDPEAHFEAARSRWWGLTITDAQGNTYDFQPSEVSTGIETADCKGPDHCVAR